MGIGPNGSRTRIACVQRKKPPFPPERGTGIRDVHAWSKLEARPKRGRTEARSPTGATGPHTESSFRTSRRLLARPWEPRARRRLRRKGKRRLAGRMQAAAERHRRSACRRLTPVSCGEARAAPVSCSEAHADACIMQFGPTRSAGTPALLKRGQASAASKFCRPDANSPKRARVGWRIPWCKDVYSQDSRSFSAKDLVGCSAAGRFPGFRASEFPAFPSRLAEQWPHEVLPDTQWRDRAGFAPASLLPPLLAAARHLLAVTSFQLFKLGSLWRLYHSLGQMRKPSSPNQGNRIGAMAAKGSGSSAPFRPITLAFGFPDCPARRTNARSEAITSNRSACPGRRQNERADAPLCAKTPC